MGNSNFKQSKPKCDSCDKTFETDIDLKSHVAKFHTIQYKLNKNFSNEHIEQVSDDVTKRYEKNDEEKVFDCLQEMKKLAKVIPSKGGSLLKPKILKKVHEGQKHSGNSLLKPKISEVKIHKVEQKKYDCHICNRVFRWKENFHGHLKSTHGDSNEYICDICDEQFKFTDELKSHKIKAHESKNTKSVTSDVVTNKIAKNQVVNNIVTNKIAKNQVVNNITSEETSENAENLSKTFSNTTSGKSFEKSQHLSRHKYQVHEGQKHFCPYCNQSFKMAYLLKNHISSKHFDKELPEYLKFEQKPKVERCKICGEVFENQINLKEHLSEFHHSCKFCDDAFKNSGLLGEHISKFHEKNNQEITPEADIKTKQDINTNNSVKNTHENVDDTNFVSKNSAARITKHEVKNLSGKHKMPQSLASLGPSISITRMKISSNFDTSKSSYSFKNR